MIGIITGVIHFVLNHESGLVKDVLFDAMQLIGDDGSDQQCECAIRVIMISVDTTQGKQCTNSNICQE